MNYNLWNVFEIFWNIIEVFTITFDQFNVFSEYKY